jgi:hypothetical protein
MLTDCSSSQSAGAAASRVGMDEAEADAKGPPRGHVDGGARHVGPPRARRGPRRGVHLQVPRGRLQCGRPRALVAVDAKHPRHRGVRRRPSGQMGLGFWVP